MLNPVVLELVLYYQANEASEIQRGQVGVFQDSIS